MGGEADEHAGPVVSRTEGNEVSITINAHSSPSHGSIIIASATAAAHPLTAHGTSASRLVRALRGDRPEITPVWFMRQAGRSLPEYRALRATGTMLDACLSPELASEITMQPVRRHGVDAAVFFSDIIVPLHLVGVEVEIAAGRGPVFRNPVRTAGEIAALVRIDPALVEERGEAVVEAVQRTVAMLAFTLAAYLVEGGPSKDHLGARSLIHSDPAAWADLTAWLAEVTGRFLALQVRAGASAAQLFDSWAGALAPADYRRAVLPASAAALEPVRALRGEGLDVPLIHFGVGTGEILADMASIGVDAIGVDYRVDLDDAVTRIGRDLTVQGNLDPALLFAPEDVRRRAAHAALASGLAARAHVFNLGHGVPMNTDPTVLTDLVRTVHDWRAPAESAR